MCIERRNGAKRTACCKMDRYVFFIHVYLYFGRVSARGLLESPWLKAK